MWNSPKYVNKKSPRGNTILGLHLLAMLARLGAAVDTAGMITLPFSERRGRRRCQDQSLGGAGGSGDVSGSGVGSASNGGS